MHTNARKSLAKIERQLKMPLDAFLVDQYDKKRLSFREISDGLKDQGIGVSRSTLHRWYHHLCGRPRSIGQAIANWWS